MSRKKRSHLLSEGKCPDEFSVEGEGDSVMKSKSLRPTDPKTEYLKARNGAIRIGEQWDWAGCISVDIRQ